MLISTPQPFPIPSAVAEDTLLALYEFEDNVNDTSGNSRNATAPNGISYTTGIIGSKAGTLNGTNQYVELPALADWDDLDGVDFSVFLWFNSTDNSETNSQIIGNYSTLASGGPTPNQFWYLNTINTGQVRSTYRRDNGAETVVASSTTDIVDGSDHFVGFIKRGLDLEIWVDNVKENTATLLFDGSCANNQPVRIGVNFGRYLAMTADQCRLYKKALSVSEINALYNE
jgi:hypothetical protein